MNLPTKSQLLKQNLLKRFCFIMISLLGCINIISCGGDEPEDPQKPITPEQPEETRYYVKYEIEMPSQLINTEKSISYVSEKGDQSFKTTDKKWQGTYGPLKKGNRVYLIIKSNSPDEYNNVKSYNRAKIYISRDKEPFVIKAEDEGRKDLSLTYTIDF